MKKLSLAGLFALVSTSAFAHHPMGGQTPSTFFEGLLSGVGHPIIGVDHLAFVVAVGIAAALAGSRFLSPLAFVIATIAGTAIHVMAINLPAVELMIAASLVVLGVVVFMGKKMPVAALAGIFAIAGLFHGFAYGEAIFGAEATPLYAYLAGFGLTQYAIAIVAGSAIVTSLGKAREWSANVPARVTGGIVAGAGGLLMSEHVLAALNLAG
ncbi:MAG: hydrogenase [Rhizobiaceae bacterium]|nr:hydrogenase [Rhizobiaceae bacterium]